MKFTPDGGVGDGRRRGASAPRRSVSVRDTGIGIAEAEQDRIFEAFQRGGRAARTSTEGTGPRPHAVEADRRPPRRPPVDGERARRRQHVLVRDPRRARSARRDDRPAEPSEPVAASERGMGSVLIVEDDRRSAELLRVYLEGAGYAVSIARDGVEGARAGRGGSRPAAVILDILLPRLNGWELLARLKSDPATSAIPVVIVSMIDEQGAGFALGAADYLVKPVDRAQPARRAGPLRGAAARADARWWRSTTTRWIWTSSRRCSRPRAGSVVRADGRRGRACEWCGSERPAVVVLDLLMPDVDGFAVVEQLRADPLVDDVPIVVLTSKDMTRADHERLAGQISYLAQKGTFPQAELVDLVGRVAGAQLPEVDAMTDRRAGPDRRGQPEEPEAGARHPQSRGLRDPGGRERRGRARARPRPASRPRPDGRPAARAWTASQALGRLRCRPGDRRHPRDRAHRVRDEGRIGSGSSRPASTTTSRSRSTSASSRDRSPRRSPRDGERAHDACPSTATILVVDDLPQNVRLLEAILAPRGYRVVVGQLGR